MSLVEHVGGATDVGNALGRDLGCPEPAATLASLHAGVIASVPPELTRPEASRIPMVSTGGSWAR